MTRPPDLPPGEGPPPEGQPAEEASGQNRRWPASQPATRAVDERGAPDSPPASAPKPRPTAQEGASRPAAAEVGQESGPPGTEPEVAEVRGPPTAEVGAFDKQAPEAAARAEPVGPAEPGAPEPAIGESGVAEPTAGELAAPEPAAPEPGTPESSPYDLLLARLDELARLRRHDIDLVDRLHADNARLRQGELTEAMAPLLRGLLRLHDQMTSLGGDDPQSIAGILRGQLLQTLDLAVDVRRYIPPVGAAFEANRHTGVRRVPTDDPARDATVARTVRPGFERAGRVIVRPAEVEVFRLTSSGP